jgi:hypothetical protein
MKRALGILGIIVLTAGVTWLAARWQIAEERADRLDQALRDAEARASQLQGDIDAANERLAELRQKQEQTLHPPISHVYSATTRATTSRPVTLQENKAILSVEEKPTFLSQVPSATGPPAWVVYNAVGGGGSSRSSYVRIEGTSSMHDWRVEGPLIAGSASFGPGFPPPGAKAQPGPIDCKANISIPVRSLKSIEVDGKPYSDKMNEVMYQYLRAAAYPRISFALKSLTATATSEDSPIALCDGVGDLAIAGQTNSINMVVALSYRTDDSLRFDGSAKLRMSDFKLPIAGAELVRPNDEVTVSFRWSVLRSKQPEFAR